MATTPEPTVCDEIHPAITHTLSWSVQATPHTSENYKVGFAKDYTDVNLEENFINFLTSEDVTPPFDVLPDGIARNGIWLNNGVPAPCTYTLYYASGGYVSKLDITNNKYIVNRFFNVVAHRYTGNSSDGFVVIDYNTTQASELIPLLPFVMAHNAIRAIDHVDAIVATAYPVATRVLSVPPPPLTEGTISLDESISTTASFKSFIEYRGPDRQTSMWMNTANAMQAPAQGKNEAQTQWNEDVLYQDIGSRTNRYYGTAEFKNFFYDQASPDYVLEGVYEILNYPWRSAANGSVNYQWGGARSLDFSMSGESGAIVEFTNFYRNEDYLHNHVWNVKFIRYVSTHFELVTTPPIYPKITAFRYEIETLDNGTPPNIYSYKLHMYYDSTTAVEFTRDETTITEPPPAYETSPRYLVQDWHGQPSEDLPYPVSETDFVKIFENNVYFFIYLSTGLSNMPWGLYEDGETAFNYKLKIHYENIGKYQPQGVPRTGITETNWTPDGSSWWAGASDKDQPDPIPPDFCVWVKSLEQVTYKAFGVYEEGSHVKDIEIKLTAPSPPDPANIFAIDCSAIGGKNMSALQDAVDLYKAQLWPLAGFQFFPDEPTAP